MLPSGAGAADRERHAEAFAQRAAVGLVGVRFRPQAVVDMQRRYRPGQPDGEIEQRGGVAATGEEDDDTPADRSRRHPRADVAHFLAARAFNSSVVSSNPFSFTSPMCSKRRCRPAASRTARVTSTSPPAARATTRAARLTARP